jgi:hypothetical protein
MEMFSRVSFKSIRFLRVLFIIGVGSIVLSGCQTRDPRLVEAVNGTCVTEVRVEATPDVGTGLPMINGKTPEQQVAIVVAALQKVSSRDLNGYPGGATPARLVVTLQTADLASEQGRVLLGSDSYISGTVRLENLKTGQLIAQNPRVTGQNQGVKGEGLGILVAVAVNAAMTKDQQYLADKLAESFTKNVKAWLAPK